MRVIMFQERFAEKVRGGEKLQTIRCSARCKAGDILSLRRWTGKPYRSKQEILRVAICTVVSPVEINQWGLDDKDEGVFIHCPETIAKRDGFSGWTEMREWFEATHGLPFNGYVIAWR
jgi:hypothetical protein